MIREELLALADELESCGPDCDECPAFEQAECRGYRECTENVSKYCARRIREAVERDGEGATTVSAYDLLSNEDREAVAWVREHGGLAAVEKRLMPAGMEWPKVDGKPVDFKTFYVPSLGVLEAVSIYNNGACEVMSHDGIVKNATEIHVSNPEVLDADGVEIRVGDTVWDVESGIEYEVVGIHTDEDTPVMVMRTDGSHLAKAAKPSTLTHEQPESWERLEHDAEKNVCEYFGANYDCADCPLEPARCVEEAKKDIIRRAKKLAERGA